MDKNQLNKHIGYLFHSKGYRIPLKPKLDNESIWFLSDTDEEQYPIICVVLKEKDESYYLNQYINFAQQLNTDKPLMILNHSDAEQWDYTYSNIDKLNLFNELYQSSYYQHDIPDHSIRLIYSKIPLKLSPIKNTILVNRILLVIFSIICLLTTIINNIVFPTKFSFLAFGYFRYPIVAFQEYYRGITAMFSNGNLIFVGVMIYMLFNYLSWFQISYSAKKFWFVVFGSSLFNTVLSILLNIEYLNNGLAPLIASFVGIFFFEKFSLYLKFYPHINWRIMINYRLLFVVGILVVYEPIAFLLGLLFALFFSMYFFIKDNKTLKKHYSISLLILTLVVMIILPISLENNRTLDDNLYYHLKQELDDDIFKDWIEQIGEQYEQ